MTPTEKHLKLESAFTRLITAKDSYEDSERDFQILESAGWAETHQRHGQRIWGPPPSQRLSRVLLRVVRANAKKGVVRVAIPGFNPRLTISIPFHLMPSEMVAGLKPGDRFCGYVNIGAESWRDLVFVDFERE